MLNWQIKMIPEEKRIAFLHALLKTKRIEVTEQYLIDLVLALNFDNAKPVSENIAILGMFGKLLKPMGQNMMDQRNKDNDRIIREWINGNVSDRIMKECIKVLQDQGL